MVVETYQFKNLNFTQDTNQLFSFYSISLDFQASYKLDVPSLCIDFQEDIEFHFSLGWQAILRKFLAPHNAGLAIALGANVSTVLQYKYMI